MKTMDAAMSVSIRGGNQSALGAMPSTEAPSVIEWAAVKAVTTETRGQKRRIGITRQSRKRRWSMPFRMWAKPSTTKRRKAWCHLGSRRTRPGFPVYW